MNCVLNAVIRVGNDNVHLLNFNFSEVEYCALPQLRFKLKVKVKVKVKFHINDQVKVEIHVYV